MTATLAVVLAALAAGLFARKRQGVLSARLSPSGHLPPATPTAERRARLGRGAGGLGRLHKTGLRSMAARLTGRVADPGDEADVVEACLALGAELQAGAPVPRALVAIADDWPHLFTTAAARASTGGDVAAALREAATTSGVASLRAVAAGWEITDRTGAPLSGIVIAVADSLRSEAAVRREAHSQLSTVRATARLLAVLPFGTLLLLSGGDGAAVSFLLSTPVGIGCLGGAILFVSAGLWWVGRLARSAMRSTWDS
jgi:tight adherence protein B